MNKIKSKLNKILLYTILAGASFFGGNNLIKNNLNAEIESEIPSTSKIEDYKVNDSKYWLVHVKQAHLIPDLEKIANDISRIDDSNKIKIAKSLQEIFENTNIVQKDIYDILSYLIKNKKISEVREESVFEGEETSNEFITKEYLKNNKNLNDLLRIWNKDKTKDYNEKIKYLPNATWVLCSENKIKLLPASNKKESFIAWESQKKELIYEGRENYLLEIISKDKNPLQIVVYGGSHNLKDNIEQWNKKFPNKMFSFKEITPENYDECVKNIEKNTEEINKIMHSAYK